jgi:hypothetical protein
MRRCPSFKPGCWHLDRYGIPSQANGKVGFPTSKFLCGFPGVRSVTSLRERIVPRNRSSVDTNHHYGTFTGHCYWNLDGRVPGRPAGLVEGTIRDQGRSASPRDSRISWPRCVWGGAGKRRLDILRVACPPRGEPSTREIAAVHANPIVFSCCRLFLFLIVPKRCLFGLCRWTCISGSRPSTIWMLS